MQGPADGNDHAHEIHSFDEDANEDGVWDNGQHEGHQFPLSDDPGVETMDSNSSKTSPPSRRA